MLATQRPPAAAEAAALAAACCAAAAAAEAAEAFPESDDLCEGPGMILAEMITCRAFIVSHADKSHTCTAAHLKSTCQASGMQSLTRGVEHKIACLNMEAHQRMHWPRQKRRCYRRPRPRQLQMTAQRGLRRPTPLTPQPQRLMPQLTRWTSPGRLYCTTLAMSVNARICHSQKIADSGQKPCTCCCPTLHESMLAMAWHGMEPALMA